MHLVLAICAIKKYVLALKQPFYATMVQTLHLKHPPNMPSFCFISFSNIHAAILISAYVVVEAVYLKSPLTGLL